jgi:hypothetical protein
MKSAQFTVIGLVLLVAGLWLGFAPVETAGGEDCGSPFKSNVASLELSGALSKLGSAYSGSGYGDLGFKDAAAECRDQFNTTKPLAIGLLVLGSASLLAGLVGVGGRPSEENAGPGPVKPA